MAETEIGSGARTLHTRRELVRAGVGVAGIFTLGPAFWQALAAPGGRVWASPDILRRITHLPDHAGSLLPV